MVFSKYPLRMPQSAHIWNLATIAIVKAYVVLLPTGIALKSIEINLGKFSLRIPASRFNPASSKELNAFRAIMGT